jgi:hypothetical protein
MKDELGKKTLKRSWPIQTHYSNTILDEVNKTTINFSQASGCLDRDSNLEPPVYRAEGQPLGENMLFSWDKNAFNIRPN